MCAVALKPTNVSRLLTGQRPRVTSHAAGRPGAASPSGPPGLDGNRAIIRCPQRGKSQVAGPRPLEVPRLRRSYFLPSTGNRFSTNGNSFGPAHPSHSRVTDFSLMSMTRNLNVLVPSLTSPDSPFVNVRSLIRATRRSAVPRPTRLPTVPPRQHRATLLTARKAKRGLKPLAGHPKAFGHTPTLAARLSL